MSADRPDNWIWVDLETTCLDERSPDAFMLEIGLIAVDARLNEVAHWGSAIKFPRGDLSDVLRRCGNFEMHQNSGLYGELTGAASIREFAAGGLPTLAEAEAVACQFVATFAPPLMQLRRDGQGDFMAAGSPMCGANIGFDRAWIKVHMPKLAALRRRAVGQGGNAASRARRLPAEHRHRAEVLRSAGAERGEGSVRRKTAIAKRADAETRKALRRRILRVLQCDGFYIDSETPRLRDATNRRVAALVRELVEDTR